MNHSGNLLGQTLLQGALTRVLTLLLDEGVNLLLGQHGEYLDVFFGVLVGDIEPELIELVGRRALGVEPYVAVLGLAELLAVGLGNERAGQREGVIGTLETADKLRAGGDVAPLVGTA